MMRAILSPFVRFPILSGGFLITLILLGIFAPIIAPYDPYIGDIRARLQKPGVVSSIMNQNNYDLIQSQDQVDEIPEWIRAYTTEDKNDSKITINKGEKGIIEFYMGPATSFVDKNRNRSHTDDVTFDIFTENCLGQSKNHCPKPNIQFTKVYKKESIGYIEYVANEDIVDDLNDMISIDINVMREDTKKWPWWPSGLYLLGTDQIGRDYFSRLIYGGRWNLTLMLITGVVGSIVGASLGMITGWYAFRPNGRWIIDEIILRIVDITSVVPILLIAIMATLVLGNSIWIFVIILTLFTWQNFVRIIRAKTLSLRTLEYINMAKISGASTFRILRKHILPSHLNDIMVIATYNCSLIITLEAVMCFFEIAIPRHWTAWGNMMKLGSEYWNYVDFSGTYPYRYQMLIPSGLVIITVLSLNFLGDWARDKLDPKLREFE